MSAVQFKFCTVFFVDKKTRGVIEALEKLADKYGVSKSAVAIAWILRHPVGIQAIAGTMNPEHLIDICHKLVKMVIVKVQF